MKEYLKKKFKAFESKNPLWGIYMFICWVLFKISPYIIAILKNIDTFQQISWLNWFILRILICIIFFIYLLYFGLPILNIVFNFFFFQYLVFSIFLIVNLFLLLTWGIQILALFSFLFISFFSSTLYVFNIGSYTVFVININLFFSLLVLMSFFNRFNKNVLIPALFSEMALLKLGENEKIYINWCCICLLIEAHIDLTQKFHALASGTYSKTILITKIFSMENKIVHILAKYALSYFPLTSDQINKITPIYEEYNTRTKKCHIDMVQKKIDHSFFLEKSRGYAKEFVYRLKQTNVQEDLKNEVLRKNHEINLKFQISLLVTFLGVSIIFNFL